MTKGNILKGLIIFALPMMAGNLLQQMYNIADTIIVGQVVGRNALAAVGSSYTIMVFLTSVFLGLAMGAGAVFSIYFGKKDISLFRSATAHSFVLIMLTALVINILIYVFTDDIMKFLQVPSDIYEPMNQYLDIIFAGLVATALYNFLSCLLRAAGNSVAPLWFLGIAAFLNVGFDILFVIHLDYGISGAAFATVIAQYVSAIGLLIYTLIFCKEFVPRRDDIKWNGKIFAQICHLSVMTCIQQSVMNLGILLVQRLVDSFGAVTMAAFAAAVKIDSFAYLPVQDFGNAFSTFTAQNYGAGQSSRIKEALKKATILSAAFSSAAAAAVFIFAEPLMRIFVSASETEVIAAGVRYLHIEGVFYAGIGCLFLLYGFYRAVEKPGMSVVLTVISLGTRVLLAYILAGIIGETGIWISVPIGWLLADIAGYGYCILKRKRLFSD